ncbi:MAG: SDR family oxidoreductase [Gemmatimonadota bacterium]
MTADLRGRAAIVTGATRGIGRACALALAREGVDVAVAGKSTEERPNLPGTVFSVAREIESLGARALPVACDVRDREQVAALVAATVERFGRLDILVCNAGAMWWRPVLETPAKRFDLMMQVNVEHAFFASREAIPHMRRGGWGHIVTMSPPVDLRWLPGHVAYCISKLGMTMLALGLAEELRGEGVAVNALWPVTIIESQASINHALGEPSTWRTAEIVADALVAIVRHEPAELTGRALLDEPFLRSLGVSDFARYSVVPGSTPPPLEELWGRARRH